MDHRSVPINNDTKVKDAIVTKLKDESAKVATLQAVVRLVDQGKSTT